MTDPIEKSCERIAAAYDDAKNPPRPIEPGGSSSPDSKPPDRGVWPRMNAHHTLAFWAQRLHEEVPETIRAGERVDLTDFGQVLRFVASEADTIRARLARPQVLMCEEELQDAANMLEAVAYLQPPSPIHLGKCPVQIPDADGHLVECGGDITIKSVWDNDAPADDGVSPAGAYVMPKIVACPMCGTMEDLDWWHEKIMGGKHEPVTAAELVIELRKRMGITVTEAGLRMFASRGVLKPVQRGERGGKPYLYDVEQACAAFADRPITKGRAV